MNTGRIVIIGVTASGKGRLAFDLAEHLGGEIISVDSMKVYRRMNIGTAKPTQDARRRINYHLIDVVEPSESFSVGMFLEKAYAAIEQIEALKKPVIAVGGTGLYLKALLYGLFDGPGSDEQLRENLRQQAKIEGLEQLHRRLTEVDPTAAEHIHPNDFKRIIRALEVYQLTGRPISSFQQQWETPAAGCKWTIVGLRREKTIENSRINQRVKKMIEAGLVDEVKSLLAEDKPLSMQARCAIGYAEIIDYLHGNISLDNAVELIKKNSRRLAKAQRTWFKTFREVNWLDVDADEPPERIFIRAKELLGNLKTF
jgi:tRNA dimethylallyltransferase